VRESPDNYDAELLLRLYELRREEKLRRAREWMMGKFQADSAEDLFKRYPPGSEENAFFRMDLSYWDMAASLVNHGLLKEDLFFENTMEPWATWEKVKHLVPGLREARKNPLAWNNLETLAHKYEQWMAVRAPEALDAFRKRLKDAAKK
jgi:broad specificity phosphatase PhoE